MPIRQYKSKHRKWWHLSLVPLPQTSDSSNYFSGPLEFELTRFDCKSIEISLCGGRWKGLPDNWLSWGGRSSQSELNLELRIVITPPMKVSSQWRLWKSAHSMLKIGSQCWWVALLCRVIFILGPQKGGARRLYAGGALGQSVFNGKGIGTKWMWRLYAGGALAKVAQTTGFTVFRPQKKKYSFSWSARKKNHWPME